MAHFQQQQFVAAIASSLPHHFHRKRVLEIGSWDANGSIRHRFTECDYLGVDVAPGPGVDMVCPGQHVDLPDQSFDVVASLECFEHNPHWPATFHNMIRMLKPGGLCFVTCASIGRGEHGTSRRAQHASLTALSAEQDYYANLRKGDLAAALDLPAFFGKDYRLFYNVYFCDLYFVGIKQPSETGLPSDLMRKVACITEEQPPGFSRRLNVHFTFAATYAFARLLGERRYHDFKFNARRALRRLGSRR